MYFYVQYICMDVIHIYDTVRMIVHTDAFKEMPTQSAKNKLIRARGFYGAS